jgi:hypothetical protein
MNYGDFYPSETANPDTDCDRFLAQVEEIYGSGTRDTAVIVEFTERMFTHFKVRGELSSSVVKALYAKMADEPRKFVPALPRS